jgi:cyclophilin family peptidyl-prolyl cis-trans isomerase
MKTSNKNASNHFGRKFCAILLSAAATLLAACGDSGNQNAGRANGNQTGNGNRAATSATQPGNQNAAPVSTGPNSVAVINTEVGTIKVELLKDQAPRTAENFQQLAERGYYNGTIFHRVVSGFMIQGGDPQGTGVGGETASGQPLPNEINRNSPLYQGGYKRGQVAMANKGRPESGGSQFFIMHKDYPLPPNYTIFGRVTEGLDTVDKIASAPVNGERPVKPVKMTGVTIQK